MTCTHNHSKLFQYDMDNVQQLKKQQVRSYTSYYNKFCTLFSVCTSLLSRQKCNDKRLTFNAVSSLVPRPNFLCTQRTDGRTRDRLSVRYVNISGKFGRGRGYAVSRELAGSQYLIMYCLWLRVGFRYP